MFKLTKACCRNRSYPIRFIDRLRFVSNSYPFQQFTLKTTTSGSECSWLPAIPPQFDSAGTEPRRIPIPAFDYFQDPDRTCDHVLKQETLTNCSWIGSKALVQEVGKNIEEYLGIHKFSVKSSLGEVFGNYNEIINLFTFRNSHEDHPLHFLASLLEVEARFKAGIEATNPYPLWRSMMTLLSIDMFRPKDSVEDSKSEVYRITSERLQRMAKIAEIAYISQQIHKRILDSDNFRITNPISSAALNKNEVWQRISDLHNANKTATLVGDLLWSQICSHMASLKCQTVSEMICEFLMTYCEGEFIFKPKSITQMTPNSRWFQRTQLGLGSLMGTTISAALGFDRHGDHIRNCGYRLGMLLGLFYQAYDDVMFFVTEPVDTNRWLDMGLLPVLYKIEKNPQLLLNDDHAEIFRKVRSDEEVSARCYTTLKILQADTLSYINGMDKFTSEEGRQHLLRYVNSLVR